MTEPDHIEASDSFPFCINSTQKIDRKKIIAVKITRKIKLVLINFFSFYTSFRLTEIDGRLIASCLATLTC